jgi:RND family efflux transporter MFP subunit
MIRIPIRFSNRSLLLVALGLLLGLSAQLGAQQIEEPGQVTVRRPERIPVTDHLESTGTFEASASANIVARVDGVLEAIHFRDGSLVEKGTPLFSIQRDTYEEQLKLYEAQLAQAQSEYARQLRLIAKDATSQTRVESWRAKRDEAAANTSLARINLGYTEVSAPFAGQMGRRLVDVGNLVGPNTGTTELAQLQQINPIYLYFSLNAPDALEVRRLLLPQVNPKSPAVATLPVQAALGSAADYGYKGRLDYIDPGVDSGSGTIQLRAVFDNPDVALLPGLFARVRVPLGQPIERLAVPNRSVQQDQAGAYVLVVDAKDRVQKRRVQLGQQEGELRAVNAGLTAQDRVIVTGLAYAREGETVEVKEEGR